MVPLWILESFASSDHLHPLSTACAPRHQSHGRDDARLLFPELAGQRSIPSRASRSRSCELRPSSWNRCSLPTGAGSRTARTNQERWNCTSGRRKAHPVDRVANGRFRTEPFSTRAGRVKAGNCFGGPLDNHIMVADYPVQGDSFVSGKPRLWSPVQILAPSGIPNMDVSADGKRLVVFPRPEVKEETGSVHLPYRNLLTELTDLRCASRRTRWSSRAYHENACFPPLSAHVLFTG